MKCGGNVVEGIDFIPGEVGKAPDGLHKQFTLEQLVPKFSFIQLLNVRSTGGGIAFEGEGQPICSVREELVLDPEVTI